MPVNTETNREIERERVHPEPARSQSGASSYTGPTNVQPASPGLAKMLVGAALIVLITAGVITLLNRKSETDALAKETDSIAVPTVAVVRPQSEAANDELILPGNLQAFEESPIFARTNGYLLRWYKDIGSKVQKGDLLAAIDTPEVDQELAQAKASREQVKSALGLAKISADRWANLRKSDSVSQQEADQQASGYQQAEANLAAADANVRRLEQLESFKRVYAPFSGVLTRRNVDPGVLINSGAGLTGKELFDIARVDPLRVYVSVPQAYAPAMKVGVKAQVTLQEFPGQKFIGTVVRTADAIDPATRTLNTEVDVPNKDGKLLPGKSILRPELPFRELRFRSTRCCFAPRGRRWQWSTKRARCSCARLRLAATSAPRLKFLAASTSTIKSSSTLPIPSKPGRRSTWQNRGREPLAREGSPVVSTIRDSAIRTFVLSGGVACRSDAGLHRRPSLQASRSPSA
jgi:RND family efflux transporter MFP subunit